MGVIVKGKKMPKKCQYCMFMRWYPGNGKAWCNASSNRLLKRECFAEIDIDRPADCPLVEVKTPHGRLIDADALIADIKECIEAKDDNCEWEQVQGLEVALSCIMDNAPTVIEAED